MSITVINKNTDQLTPGEYIGRPSPLGNPFTHLARIPHTIQVATREESVARYLPWLREQWVAGGPEKEELRRLALLYGLSGNLVLICYCKPLACHGDVLAEVIPKVSNIL